LNTPHKNCKGCSKTKSKETITWTGADMST
jgi:hypothetical protein